MGLFTTLSQQTAFFKPTNADDLESEDFMYWARPFKQALHYIALDFRKSPLITLVLKNSPKIYTDTLSLIFAPCIQAFENARKGKGIVDYANALILGIWATIVYLPQFGLQAIFRLLAALLEYPERLCEKYLIDSSNLLSIGLGYFIKGFCFVFKQPFHMVANVLIDLSHLVEGIILIPYAIAKTAAKILIDLPILIVNILSGKATWNDLSNTTKGIFKELWNTGVTALETSASSACRSIAPAIGLLVGYLVAPIAIGLAATVVGLAASAAICYSVFSFCSLIVSKAPGKIYEVFYPQIREDSPDFRDVPQYRDRRSSTANVFKLTEDFDLLKYQDEEKQRKEKAKEEEKRKSEASSKLYDEHPEFWEVIREAGVRRYIGPDKYPEYWERDAQNNFKKDNKGHYIRKTNNNFRHKESKDSYPQASDSSYLADTRDVSIFKKFFTDDEMTKTPDLYQLIGLTSKASPTEISARTKTMRFMIRGNGREAKVPPELEGSWQTIDIINNILTVPEFREIYERELKNCINPHIAYRRTSEYITFTKATEAEAAEKEEKRKQTPEKSPDRSYSRSQGKSTS